MAFEITVAEALAILQVTHAELRFLVDRGDLQQFVVRDRKGKVVRRFLHYEEAVELAKRLERPIPVPKRPRRPRQTQPRDPSLLATPQVRRLAGLTSTELRRLVAEDRLHVAAKEGNGRYYRQEEVAALVEQLKAERALLPAVRPAVRKPARDPEFVGVMEATALLQTYPRKIYACIARGELPVARTDARGLRLFRRSDVAALADTVNETKRRFRKTA